MSILSTPTLLSRLNTKSIGRKMHKGCTSMINLQLESDVRIETDSVTRSIVLAMENSMEMEPYGQGLDRGRPKFTGTAPSPSCVATPNFNGFHRLSVVPSAIRVQDDENKFFHGEVVTQLKNFLKELFMMYGVVNMPFLKQQLRDRCVIIYFGRYRIPRLTLTQPRIARQEKDPVLNRGTPDPLIRHVLAEMAFNVQNAYCMKSVGDSTIDKASHSPSTT